MIVCDVIVQLFHVINLVFPTPRVCNKFVHKYE